MAESLLTSSVKQTRLNGNQSVMIKGGSIWEMSVEMWPPRGNLQEVDKDDEWRDG